MKPDFLFVESAWRGAENSWSSKLTNLNEKPESKIWELMEYCRSNQIRTVFWNKEDPVNYDLFIDAAKLFDTVFTTDENCLEKYYSDLNHMRVFVLPFASQPAIHNPVNETSNDKSNVAFAGSWFQKYEERVKDMEILLKPAIPYGLQIFDRMQNIEKYRYPEQFLPYIVGSLDYNEMVTAYKNYKLFLNVNTVKDSPTMLSRRVFELLGSGTNVISTYSLGIENMFAGIIPLVQSEEECSQYIHLLLQNPEFSQRLSLLGIREINSKHLYKHRFQSILNKIGIDYSQVPPSGVSIITCTNRQHNMDNIFENYEHQKWGNKELIIILNHDGLNIKEWKQKAELYPNVSVYRIPEEKSLGVCMNFAVDKAKHDYIAKFDDDDYYAPNYLTDAMHAFNYTDTDIVGKHTYYAYVENLKALTIRFPGNENQFGRFLAGPTLLIKKDVFNIVKWPDQERGGDTAFLRECRANGVKMYSSDKYNFCYRRSNPENHTWRTSNLAFLQNCSIMSYSSDYKTHVTV
ncbi:glycosyltransferase family protein [Paenibacillus spongiae]|uniref:Glycosyltransferase n=1 Tax=Paenibacillus spongiae TaxID=2909671 RepID=A0ABY5S400_9BACL|nr:glycosyltransferase [Paenibacillus spongiae]UVI28636.1 glycosyltransferase [Paenibacillus spongiae]